MSGVTASRGEMMQVTPDVARDQREFSFLSAKKKKKYDAIAQKSERAVSYLISLLFPVLQNAKKLHSTNSQTWKKCKK